MATLPTRHPRRRRRLVALSLLTTLVVVPAAPADADAASALSRCQTGGQADFSDAADVLGNGGGSIPDTADPDNILLPDDAFVVRPLLSDRVRVDLWGANYGPDGNGTVAQGNWPFPGRNQFSEILRFNNKPGGWVGPPEQATSFQGCRTWNGGVPVRLLFAVNDPTTWDNGGLWATNVSIWRASK
ncbi:hypothetical protein [Streptosporangium sp. KLBMP 9127]|nr:hypothetical protein [Streptosporangium sp. KLBMP 9127]